MHTDYDPTLSLEENYKLDLGETLDVDRPLTADTCDWPDCPHCAALRTFVEKWNRGEVPHDPDWEEKDWRS
jgi:hypothetical protein